MKPFFEKQTFNLDVPYFQAGLEVQDSPTVSAFLCGVSPEIGEKKRPAVIICPGGGYGYVSDREADPVALRFVAFGVHAFVLNYSVGNKPFPTALLELATAIDFIRKNSDAWDINAANISVCGFSAGGHLAASLAVHWNKDFIQNVLKNSDCRPNKAILCYPVITSGKYAHQGSIDSIIGSTPTQEMLELVSLEKHVGEHVPPVFIWHCSDDGCVPVQNSLNFMSALSNHSILFEAHIYPEGGHGIALADHCTAAYDGHINTQCASWFKQAVHFIFSF